MAEFILELKNISQEFIDENDQVHKVLDNVSLQIKEGESIALVGPSGCGKTTLLNIIGGFYPQKSGEIRINGKPPGRPNRDRGIVYQDYALFPWMTVLENIVYGFELEQINFLEKYIFPFRFRKVKKEAKKKAEFYLEETGLTEAAQKYPHQLSGGMKQRVAIAQALIMKPQILLMDEPFGALDIQTRESLQIMMLKIREQQNNTIFFVTHDLEEALYLGSRVILLSQYHTPGVEAINGARVVYNEELPEELMFLSTQVKDSLQFRDMISKLTKIGFRPTMNQEIEQFNQEQKDLKIKK